MADEPQPASVHIGQTSVVETVLFTVAAPRVTRLSP